MITVSEIKAKAERKYNDFLKWKITEFYNSDGTQNPFFPIEIKADKGSTRDNLFQRESDLKPLIQKSKANCGKGYTLIFEETKTRNNGIQSRLSKIVFETEEDFLSFINKQKETERAIKAITALKKNCHSELISESFIKQWALKNLSALTASHSDEQNFWEKLCLCVNWLNENPQSNLYIREIPLQVHTKFIENNKALILSLIFPDNTPPLSAFESSLGLKQKPSLVRFRSLDKNNPLTTSNIEASEILIPLEDFEKFGSAQINAKLEKIFIVENEMVYLTFPQQENSICIWGHGFSVTLLKNCGWLSKHEILYFGDLDEHGFLILSDFRKHFPTTKSFCMTKEILEKYREFAVEGKKLENAQIPENLTDEEKCVFTQLRQNPEKNRLEQERIPLNEIKAFL